MATMPKIQKRPKALVPEKKLADEIDGRLRAMRRKVPGLKNFAQEFGTLITPFIASMDAADRFNPWKHKSPPNVGKRLEVLLKALEKKCRHHDSALWSLQQAAYFEPQVFSRKMIQRLEKVFRDQKDFSYFLNLLSQHPRTRPITRKTVNALLAATDRFVLRAKAQSLFAENSCRILMVHTIEDAMGDEIIRMVPLLQSLLQVNPQNQITLLTERPHLYDHPRLRVVDLRARSAILRFFEKETFDVVVNHMNPQRNDWRGSFDVQPALKALMQRQPPRLVIGRDKAYNRFTFFEVSMDGKDYLDVLRLADVPYFESHVYEPGDRLCAELALPQQFPTEGPLRDCPLTTTPYAAAAAYWQTLRRRLSDSRPVWLVNPFGGGFKEKGFFGRSPEKGFGRFRQHLCDLIDEGASVVVMPNHRAWGRPKTVRTILRSLPRHFQEHAAVGPDPLVDMRLVKYLVAKSDGVLAVEGGLIHLAHVLGKPFRVLLGEHSGDSFWLPLNGLAGVERFGQRC